MQQNFIMCFDATHMNVVLSPSKTLIPPVLFIGEIKGLLHSKKRKQLITHLSAKYSWNLDKERHELLFSI